jgi:glycosyltransferase involved in cell wall biosynthesis
VGAVCIVIPTKDRPHFLATALQTALAQEAVDLEVLVIDDGSAAGALDEVPELQDPRVRRLAAHGRGVARARNVGIAAAAAPWVAFLDDDDLWAPDKLRRQLARAEHTGADLVYCGLVVVDEAGRIVAVKPAADGVEAATSLLEGNLVCSPSTVLVRTAALRAAGGFDEDLAVLADWDLWLRLAESHRLAACPECLVAYREHAGNMSVSRVRSIDAELARLRRRHSGSVTPPRGDRSGLAVQQWVAAGVRRSGHPVDAARRYLRAGIRYRSPGSVARALLSLSGPQGTRLARWVRLRRQPPPPAWLGRRGPPVPRPAERHVGSRAGAA